MIAGFRFVQHQNLRGIAKLTWTRVRRRCFRNEHPLRSNKHRNA